MAKVRMGVTLAAFKAFRTNLDDVLREAMFLSIQPAQSSQTLVNCRLDVKRGRGEDMER